jgi:hypothetical protein
MSNGTFVLALALGAGALALWLHARFPALAPERLGRTIVHAVAAFVLLQLLPGVGQSVAGIFLGVFLFVLPGLVYALLCSLWMIKHAQTALGLQR